MELLLLLAQYRWQFKMWEVFLLLSVYFEMRNWRFQKHLTWISMFFPQHYIMFDDYKTDIINKEHISLKKNLVGGDIFWFVRMILTEIGIFFSFFIVNIIKYIWISLWYIVYLDYFMYKWTLDQNRALSKSIHINVDQCVYERERDII